jgi:hypothetical protein
MMILSNKEQILKYRAKDPENYKNKLFFWLNLVEGGK